MVKQWRVRPAPVSIVVGERAAESGLASKLLQVVHRRSEDHWPPAPTADPAVTPEYLNLKILGDWNAGSDQNT
jgi:hypothetical protein